MDTYARRCEGYLANGAADIWTDGQVSIMALAQYHIDLALGKSSEAIGYKLVEELLMAVPVDKIAHTADNCMPLIESELQQLGFPIEEKGMGFKDVVSDNGTNMVNALEKLGDGGGDCAPHTIELSAKVFYEQPGIASVKTKVRGMTTHFHQIGGANMKDFHECQASYDLPKKKPQSTGNSCRWHFDDDQWEFYAINQPAVQLYDVQYSGSRGDAYREHKMLLDDWDILKQGHGMPPFCICCT